MNTFRHHSASRVGRGAIAIVLAAAALTAASAPASSAVFAPSLSWQRQLPARIQLSSPTIADINGDGENEIVVGDLEGWVHVYRGDGAGELPGWPQQALVDGVHATAIDSAPAVADLFRDGKKEIIVGATSVWIPNQQGGLVVFDANGHLRWHWQGTDYITIWGATSFRHDGFTEGAIATPAIGDIDGDHYPDIVFGTLEAKIHALDRNGHEISGFPYQADDTVWSSASLYDSDHDGRMEIFIGSPSTGGGPQPHMGGTMFALDWRRHKVRQMWRQNIAETIDASPAIADIDGDGRAEIITTTGWAFSNAHSRMIWAWHLDDGSPVRGWPVDTGSINPGSIALGDLNGDGRPDVVAGGWDGRVRAYTGRGHKIWDADAFAGQHRRLKLEGSLTIADTDGNGRQDVIVAADNQMMILNGHNGAVMANKLGTGVAYFNAAAVGFLDGSWSLVLAGFRGGNPTPESSPAATGQVSVYRLGNAVQRADWPMFRQNPSRQGRIATVAAKLMTPWQCGQNITASATHAGASRHRVSNGAVANRVRCGPFPFILG